MHNVDKMETTDKPEPEAEPVMDNIEKTTEIPETQTLTREMKLPTGKNFINSLITISLQTNKINITKNTKSMFQFLKIVI